MNNFFTVSSQIVWILFSDPDYSGQQCCYSKAAVVEQSRSWWASGVLSPSIQILVSLPSPFFGKTIPFLLVNGEIEIKEEPAFAKLFSNADWWRRAAAMFCWVCPLLLFLFWYFLLCICHLKPGWDVFDAWWLPEQNSHCECSRLTNSFIPVAVNPLPVAVRQVRTLILLAYSWFMLTLWREEII